MNLPKGIPVEGFLRYLPGQTLEHIRSDNGPEFIAINVREWLGRIGVKTLYIEPGSPWENGYCESLNSKRSTARSSRRCERRRY
jgi:transposase InsO family protein